jgi:hypothetical protein
MVQNVGNQALQFGAFQLKTVNVCPQEHLEQSGTSKIGMMEVKPPKSSHKLANLFTNVIIT